MCDDPWHAALHMLQAANVHPEVHMPVPDHDCYPMAASGSPLLGVDDEMNELIEEEQDAAQLGSTHAASQIQSALSEAAYRARQLLTHQVSSSALQAHVATTS